MPRTQGNRALPALAEVFRLHGFEGASLALISAATGLGKGSLYNLFPGGKDEMMNAVLADIDAWFVANVFGPLEDASDPAAAVAATMRAAGTYFRSGGRVCLVGCVGLTASRDRFAARVRTYFARWVSALAACLGSAGLAQDRAERVAEETVAAIQGAIVLARALDDDGVFARIVARQEARLASAVGAGLPPRRDEGRP